MPRVNYRGFKDPKQAYLLTKEINRQSDHLEFELHPHNAWTARPPRRSTGRLLQWGERAKARHMRSRPASQLANQC